MAPILPIRTPRLTVRMMEPADAPALAAYRNEPDVARHQLWDLPYTLEQAEQVIAGQHADEQFEVGGRYQLAIEVDLTVVGDVYVALSDPLGVAEIGYTLATAHQQRGYATEAAGAVVEALFERLGLARVYGELDPVNVDSQRVLERIGLVHEATTRRSYWWRGEWSDNMTYAATRTQFDEWRRRPRLAPAAVRLVELTTDNHADYRRLRTHHSEQRFVASNDSSMIDALFPEVIAGAPVVPWLRGIEADGDPVGLMMVAEVTAHHPEPYLWRLMIDRLHQRRRIGGRALALLVERLREQGVSSLLTSWGEGRGGPRPFYERLGFRPTGEVEDGETMARLMLS